MTSRENTLVHFLFIAPQSFIARQATGSVIATAISMQTAICIITKVANIHIFGPLCQNPTLAVLFSKSCTGGATEWRRSKPLTLVVSIGAFR